MGMGNKVSTMQIPGLKNTDGLVALERTDDGLFASGSGGVRCVAATGDGKLELVAFAESTLACVKSALGWPAYYPLHEARFEAPAEAVLMDLDGTTVKSEEFWMWTIRETTRTLADRPTLDFEDADVPHISGHSVAEHLQYCIDKYCPGAGLQRAKQIYTELADAEMEKITKGCGRKGAFTPAEGVKEFLLELKGRGIKIGLVTSGQNYKAMPEILSAFETLGLGNPLDFYDSIITGGERLGRGRAGTLGELEIKPHPWLYAESAFAGLGVPFERRHRVLGIEDSAAGVCSVRLAGYYAVGLAGGNILQSGAGALCNAWCERFEDILPVILGS